MVKQRVNGILFSALVIVVSLSATTIVKNGSKVSAPSMSSIKEDIGYCLRDTVHELIELTKEIATLEQDMLDASEALVTQDPEHFFAQANRAELLSYQKTCQHALATIKEQRVTLKKMKLH